MDFCLLFYSHMVNTHQKSHPVTYPKFSIKICSYIWSCQGVVLRLLRPHPNPTSYCCFHIKYFFCPGYPSLEKGFLMLWIWRYCQQVMAVFDIGPIKWAAENHRLSLASTLRWGASTPSLSDADASTSNIPLYRKFKSSACNRFCLCSYFCWNPVHLTRFFLLFCNWIIWHCLGFGF